MFRFNRPHVDTEPKKAPRRLPVILTFSEVEGLVSAALDAANHGNTEGRRYRSWRDFVMVQMGVLAGPRVSELCDLEVSDVDLVGTVLNIRWGKGK